VEYHGFGPLNRASILAQILQMEKSDAAIETLPLKSF
jgi:hypothetical protein